jgi:hypothetical protein
VFVFQRSYSTEIVFSAALSSEYSIDFLQVSSSQINVAIDGLLIARSLSAHSCHADLGPRWSADLDLGGEA